MTDVDGRPPSSGPVTAGMVIDNRYEILRSLGHGGMSDAYQARDRATDAMVVIKIPHAALIGDVAMYRRYERELEIGRRLRHPNIQHLLAEGHVDGTLSPYLVLEYVEGELLREYLATHAPLAVALAVDIGTQLADALEYCHQHGVVHRDLKPENVLITPEGQVKLVDFGIALLQGARRLTYRRLSAEVGTPDYMAPEQVQGERGDARTDIYAVGVLLYEMLTGEVPYRGDNALSVMSQRVTTDAPLVGSRRPDVPPGLEAVVYRALRRQPGERYVTMAALRDDLQNLDNVEIPEYQISTTAGSTWTSDRLISAAIIVGVLVFLALLGVLAELAHRAQEAHP